MSNVLLIKCYSRVVCNSFVPFWFVVCGFLVSFYIISVYCVSVVLPRILMHHSGILVWDLSLLREAKIFLLPESTSYFPASFRNSALKFSFLYLPFSFILVEHVLLHHQSLTNIKLAPEKLHSTRHHVPYSLVRVFCLRHTRFRASPPSVAYRSTVPLAKLHYCTRSSVPELRRWRFAAWFFGKLPR